MKIPNGQRLWETIYDTKGKPKWAICSDQARVKYYLYRIENNQAKKIKSGKSPMEFESEVGTV